MCFYVNNKHFRKMCSTSVILCAFWKCRVTCLSLFFLVNVKLNVSIFLCYLSQIFVALQWVCICIYFFISSWHDKWLLGSSECILVSFRPLSHCFYPPFSNASFLLQKLLYPLRGEHFKASAV